MGKKNRGQRVPRLVDMQHVPADMQRSALVSFVLEGGGPMWRSTHALMVAEYGEFALAERDILDLPEDERREAVLALMEYAHMEMPAGAPMGAREAAARSAANAQQSLKRLMQARGGRSGEPCMVCITARAIGGIVCACGHDWSCHPTKPDRSEPCGHCDCAEMLDPRMGV
ncbi:hypothetical protein [Streptomyces amritsarensis]|uniref:hypothetical protein n=1 Tax=Streptomyces amritsarensis TaxID=681158 RepID=UPI0036AC23B0